ncbi:MAG: trigger factor [Gammaproteobacteria bacterium]
MQVSIEHTDDLEYRMTVEVPEEQLTAEIQARLSSLSKRTRIDGFRPGRVPVKVIERRYGGQVRHEATEHLIHSSFREALSAQNLAVAGRPRIEPAPSLPGKGLSYTATFEIYPQIKLGNVETLEITKPVTEITEVDVEAMIEKLRRDNQDWVPVERAASEGDKVNLDFVGFVDNKAIEAGEANGFEVLIGSSILLDGFEEGLKGHSAADEFDLELRFPEGNTKPELAGKPVRFSVKVNQVFEGRLPELEAPFFAKLGMGGSNLEAFKHGVRRSVELERDRAIRSLTKRNVWEALLGTNPVELPKGLVSEESRRLVEQRKRNMLAQGIPKEKLPNLSEESCAHEARQRLTLGLILIEIVRQNGLQADPEKVRQSVEAIAAGYQRPHAVIKWYYENENHLTGVKNAVLEDEAVAWTLSKARVREVPLPFDVLMNPVHTEHLAPINT